MSTALSSVAEETDWAMFGTSKLERLFVTTTNGLVATLIVVPASGGKPSLPWLAKS